MNIAILSGGTGWHVQDLIRAAGELGHVAEVIDFRRLAGASHAPAGFCDPLARFEAVVVRTMPAGSLDQIVFRMDLLHAAEAVGRCVVNPPRALEACVDKFLTGIRLQRAGLPAPVTIACQCWQDAMQAFDTLGSDVVVKPLFGSEGRGLVRLSDRELAWRTFRAIESTGGVIYLQPFIRHPGWDVRAFVIAGHVIAAMKRTARNDWRTNVAQGGTAERFSLAEAEARLAVAAAEATGAIVAGVDLIQNERGEWLVLEVNAVPGWKALSAACEIDVAASVIGHALEVAG